MGLLWAFWKSVEDAALLDAGAMPKPELVVEGAGRQELLYCLSFP